MGSEIFFFFFVFDSVVCLMVRLIVLSIYI